MAAIGLTPQYGMDATKTEGKFNSEDLFIISYVSMSKMYETTVENYSRR